MEKPGCNSSFFEKASYYYRSLLDGLNKVADLISSQTDHHDQSKRSEHHSNKHLHPSQVEDKNNNKPCVDKTLHEDLEQMFYEIPVGVKSYNAAKFFTRRFFVFDFIPTCIFVVLRILTKKWSFEHFVKRKRKKIEWIV